MTAFNGRPQRRLALASTPTRTAEQRRAEDANAREFELIQRFAAECRRHWPGATIVLRPDGAPKRSALPGQAGPVHADNASDDPVQSEQQTQHEEEQIKQTNHE